MESKTEHKILIVDDEPDVCEVISHYLAKRDYKVISAISAKEALSKFAAEKPSLILLDILMPEIDGIECLRRIKEIDAQAMVIILTGVANLDTAKQALELGAVDYIMKPIDFDMLETLISVRLSFTKNSLPEANLT